MSDSESSQPTRSRRTRSASRSLAPAVATIAETADATPAPTPASSRKRRKRNAEEESEQEGVPNGENTTASSAVLSSSNFNSSSTTTTSSSSSNTEFSTPASRRTSTATSSAAAASASSSSSSLHSVPLSSSTATPMRASRLEEKHELQDLNKRLELYILKIRERDATSNTIQRELDLLKEKHRNDLDDLKKGYENKIEAFKRAKNDATAELAELKDAYAKATHDLTLSRSSASSFDTRINELNNKITALNNDLLKAQQALLSTQEENRRYKADNLQLEENNSSLSKQLDKTRASLEESQRNSASSNAKLVNLQQDYTMLNNKTEAEIAALTEQVDLLQKDNLEIEEKLRREFGAQLKQILADRQVQYEEEKEEAMAQLRSFYEEKLGEKTERLDALQAELENLSENLTSTQNELATERKNNSNFVAEKETLEKLIASLREQVDAWREKHQTEVNARTEIIRQHYNVLKRKDLEFQNLMDVKIALDLEIKQYRQLLENEEDRLGFPIVTTPSRSSANTPASARSARRSSGYSANALAVSVASSAHKIILTNLQSSDALSLEGFSLQANDSGANFSFPAHVTIPVDGSLEVFTAVRGAASSRKDKNALVWTLDAEEDLWKAGEVIQVLDPQDKVIHSLTIA